MIVLQQQRDVVCRQMPADFREVCRSEGDSVICIKGSVPLDVSRGKGAGSRGDRDLENVVAQRNVGAVRLEQFIPPLVNDPALQDADQKVERLDRVEREDGVVGAELQRQRIVLGHWRKLPPGLDAGIGVPRRLDRIDLVSQAGAFWEREEERGILEPRHGRLVAPCNPPGLVGTADPPVDAGLVYLIGALDGQTKAQRVAGRIHVLQALSAFHHVLGRIHAVKDDFADQCQYRVVAWVLRAFLLRRQVRLDGDAVQMKHIFEEFLARC